MSAIMDARLYPWGLEGDLAMIALCVPSVLLAMGLWTPVAGVTLALVEIVRVIQSGRLDERLAVLAIIAIGLAMTGPGQWSVDARLFGRRRIKVEGLK
jgi:putative oxidoreductase